MGDVCTDGRFDLIERFKRDLVEATNIETSPEEMAVLDSILFRMWQMGWLDKLAVSPWHRVEEPPKEEGRYWFAVWFDGHWIFDAAWYTHDISTVLDVPCFERVGGFYKGNTEVHPDYWMPIEPPKEEADANK